jgi:hypothetical protein
VDHVETFAPVTKYTSFRAVISLVSFMEWRIHQMDVKTVFLNEIIEKVYIEQPQAFEVSGKESHVCKFKKVVYGLKQGPRPWYFKIDKYL